MPSCHAQALLLLLSTYHSYCINPLLICACIPCSLLAWPEAVLAPVPCLNTIYPSKLLTPHPLPHSHPFTDLYKPKRTTHAGRRRHHDDAPIATHCFSTPALVPCLAARTPCFPSLGFRSSGLGSASRAPTPRERHRRNAKAGSSRTRTRQRNRLPGVSHTHIGGGLCFVAFTIYLLHAHTPTTRSRQTVTTTTTKTTNKSDQLPKSIKQGQSKASIART